VAFAVWPSAGSRFILVPPRFFLLVIPANAGVQFFFFSSSFPRASSGAFNSRMAGHPVPLALSSSFRRKPESSVFALDLLEGASLRFSARIRASGSLSLACARESNQREHTPGAALPAAVRKVRPGFARWASCPFANSRASLRATLSGDSGLPLPRLTGPRIKNNDKSCFALASARRTRALCSSRGPMALRRQRPIRPEGSARGIAPIPLLHRMCNQRNPADDADPTRTMRVGRKALGRVSLPTFFARAKKVGRSSAGRVEAFALNENRNKQKQKLDSRLRGNDERRAKRAPPPSHACRAATAHTHPPAPATRKHRGTRSHAAATTIPPCSAQGRRR